MKSISVVINVVKEEIGHLPKVLASIKGVAGETVLVDMTEGLEVGKIAKQFDAKVYKHKFVNFVEPARNFGIQKATGEWILILDPDEEVTKELEIKLKEIVETDKAEYVRIPRKNIVFGKALKHSRWWPDYNIRFFKKGNVSWGDIIHSIPVTSGRGIDLPENENLAIVHHHYDTLEQYIERLNRYTTVQAEREVNKNPEFNLTHLIRKPVSEFLSRYFAGEGYKDGIHGLALSGLQAFSEFVLYLKVWQLKKFEEKQVNVGEVIEIMKDVENDIHYWQADAEVKNGGGVFARLKRKLRI